MTLRTYALTCWPTVRDELAAALGASSGAIEASRPKVERMINAVSSAMIQAANGRHFEYQAGIVENHQAIGSPWIVLDRWPIKSVAAVNLLNPDGTVAFTYDRTQYQIRDTGILQWTGGTSAASTGLSAYAGPGVSSFGYQAGAIQTGWPLLAAPAGDIRQSPQAGAERPSLQAIYDGGWITPAQDLAPDGVTALGNRDLPEDLEEACLIAVEALWARRGRSRDILSETQPQGSSVSFRQPEGDGGLLPLESRAVARSYGRYL